MKTIRYLSENFQFLVVKFSIYLNRPRCYRNEKSLVKIASFFSNAIHIDSFLHIQRLFNN